MNVNPEYPWLWRHRAMFGPASVYHFLDQLAINGTNSTFGIHFLSRKNLDEDSIHSFFSIFIGLILILNLLFTTQKKKNSLTQQKVFNPRYLKYHLLYFAISLMLSPVTIILVSTLFIYKTIIYVLLSIKFGRSFAGFLHGADVLWALEDKSKAIITSLITIESDKNLNIHEIIKQKMFRVCLKYEKLSYHRERMFGYFFWRRNGINISDHVTRVDAGNLTLQELVGKYCNQDLPMKHKTLFEVIVVDRDMNGGQNDKKVTPVIARFHHTIGDGLALVELFLETLRDNEQKIKVNNFNQLPQNAVKVSENKDLHLIKQVITKMVSYLYFLLMGPGYAVHQFCMKQYGDNVLHGPDLSGEKIVEWVEEKEYSTLKSVKRIKRKLDGVYFAEVILTAISAGLHDYMKKNSDQRPEFVSVVVPVHMDILKTKGRTQNKASHVPRQKVSDECQLTNRFSILMLNLPIFPRKGNGISLLDRLTEVKRQTSVMKDTPNVLISYLLCTIGGTFLPASWIQKQLDTTHNTAAISNVPGPAELHTFHGSKIKDLLFWLPNKGCTGLGISILSYADKLYLGLLADKAIISNQKDAREILENMEKAIREMDVLTEKIGTAQVK